MHLMLYSWSLLFTHVNTMPTTTTKSQIFCLQKILIGTIVVNPTNPNKWQWHI